MFPTLAGFLTDLHTNIFLLFYFSFLDHFTYSQWRLSELLQAIVAVWNGSNGHKMLYLGLHKYLFFIQFWWYFFIGFLSVRVFRIFYSPCFLFLTVLEIQGVKRATKSNDLGESKISVSSILLSSNTLLCQTHDCVKQVLEANLFVQSVVKMLRI